MHTDTVRAGHKGWCSVFTPAASPPGFAHHPTVFRRGLLDGASPGGLACPAFSEEGLFPEVPPPGRGKGEGRAPGAAAAQGIREGAARPRRQCGPPGTQQNHFGRLPSGAPCDRHGGATSQPVCRSRVLVTGTAGIRSLLGDKVDPATRSRAKIQSCGLCEPLRL